jgi:tetratricopeptide (TPR) repeat protein
MERKNGHNSTLAIGEISFPLDSFVVAESSVLRTNFCAKKPIANLQNSNCKPKDRQKMKKTLLTFLLGLIFQICYGQAELKESFEKGVKLLQSESYKKAAETFTDILGKATDERLKKFCYIYRGFSYNGLGEYKKAVSDLDKAIELDPNDLSSYIDRGKAKAYLKDLDGAKKDFEYILTKDSIGDQGQGAFYYLGKISYQLGNFEQSINYYDKLIVLTPMDTELYFNRAVSKGMIMDVAGSIKDYDKAIELKPDFTEAYANRGVAKINLLTSKGNINPTKEQTSDGCTDLKKAQKMGDKTVEDMIFIYCNKK